MLITKEVSMSRTPFFSLLSFFLLACFVVSFGANGGEPKYGPAMKNYDWWRAARFGVFIHWGPGAFLHVNGFARENVPKGMKDDGKSRNAAQLGLPVPPEISNGGWKKFIHTPRKGGKVPMAIYDNLYRLFNPVKFDADEWVKFLKDCGAGYIVLTTKHHDGFCMWDSAYTKYDMMSTPFKRDVCKELADACHKYGIKLIWYYSKWDVYEPSYDTKNPKPYFDFMRNQVKELLTKYAPIAGMWWDGGKIKFPQEDSDKVFLMIKGIQPGYIINGRGLGRPKDGYIFGTPEQKLGAFNLKTPWETCAVIEGNSWIWNGGVDFKSPGICLNYLINCAGGDGNLLLNFGPKPDGEFPAQDRAVYRHIGEYLKKYGKSIKNTRGGPYIPGYWGVSTRAGKKIYIHVTEKWPSGKIVLPPLPAKVVSCAALTGGKPKVTQTKDALTVELPADKHNPEDTIIVLTIDRDAMSIEPIKTLDRTSPVSVNAKATASTSVSGSRFSRALRGAPESVVPYDFEQLGKRHKKEFGEDGEARSDAVAAKSGKVFSADEKKRILKLLGGRPRGDFRRWWRALPDDKKPWIELDVWQPTPVKSVRIVDYFGHAKEFELQYQDSSGAWKTFYKGKNLDNFFLELPKPITARKFRLVVLKTSGEQPSITKFDLFASKKASSKTPR